MFPQPSQFEPTSGIIVLGYVRRSSEMQKDNYSIDAQKRAIRDAASYAVCQNLPSLRTTSEAHVESKLLIALILNDFLIIYKPIQARSWYSFIR